MKPTLASVAKWWAGARAVSRVARTSYFRLLPTRLARLPLFARIARGLERGLGQGPAFRPFYVLYEWVATRPRGGDAAP